MSEHKLRMVTLAITSNCNSDCKHCFTFRKAGRQSENELSIAQWKSLLPKLVGVERLRLSGGEPLTRPDLCLELVREGKNLSLPIGIHTNGLGLSKQLSDALIKAEIAHVRFTFEGLEKTTDYLKNTAGAFEKSVSSLKYCMQNGVSTGVIVPLSRFNYGELDQLYDFFLNLDLDEFFIKPLFAMGRAAQYKDWMLSPQELKNAVYLLLQKWKTVGSKTKLLLGEVFGHLISEKNDKWITGGCGVGRWFCMVDNEGYVLPCSGFPHLDTNILKDDIFSVWQNHKFFSEMRNRSIYNERCRNCSYFDKCWGGCRSFTYSLYRKNGGFPLNCWRSLNSSK